VLEPHRRLLFRQLRHYRFWTNASNNDSLVAARRTMCQLDIAFGHFELRCNPLQQLRIGLAFSRACQDTRVDVNY